MFWLGGSRHLSIDLGGVEAVAAAKRLPDGDFVDLHYGNEVTLKLEVDEDAEDFLASFVNDEIGLFIETVGGIFIRTSEIKTLHVKPT